MTRRVLYWFRTDLRLHDSPALKVALDLAPAALYPVWCWDPHYVYSQSVGANRWQFLIDSMNDVSNQITALNPKSKMFVVRGPPNTILPALWKEWGITDIVWEKDDDAYTQPRDAEIALLAKAASVNVHVVLGHTLYDSSTILAKNKGICPNAYQSFLKLLPSLPKPALPIAAPTSLPDPGVLTLATLIRENHSVDVYRATDVNHESRETGTTERDHSYNTFAGPNGDFGVPTMEEIGMVATGKIRGGETRGLTVFEEFMKDKHRVATFEKPKTSPAAFEPPSTTQLSPHLKFGCLSVRTFYHRVLAINAEHKGATSPPESLIGQLLWREYFHAHQFATANFNQIRGNKLSRYMSWDLQTRYDATGLQIPRTEAKEIWAKEEPVAYEKFMQWSEGRTGFPWIDALMRQLIDQGWMHHLGRHSVACFLTRGHLYISWERGAEVFDKYLIDWDPAVNSGNWMWLSASAFFSQYFRVYSPATYGQKSDKTGALIRKYCPELSKFPDKFIYTPWDAPLAVQKAAGCIIGVDYPARMVDDKKAKETAMSGMKAAYAAKIQGDNLRVLNGTADAYLATFSSGGGVKAEAGSDGEEDEDTKPAVKRKIAKVKAEAKPKDAKKTKQAVLKFE